MWDIQTLQTWGQSRVVMGSLWEDTQRPHASHLSGYVSTTFSELKAVSGLGLGMRCFFGTEFLNSLCFRVWVLGRTPHASRWHGVREAGHTMETHLDFSFHACCVVLSKPPSFLGAQFPHLYSGIPSPALSACPPNDERLEGDVMP